MTNLALFIDNKTRYVENSNEHTNKTTGKKWNYQFPDIRKIYKIVFPYIFQKQIISKLTNI